MTFHDKKKRDIFKELKTTEEGLSSEEAKKRLEKYGYNEIKEEKKISPWKIFIEQFRSFMIYILIAAVIISSLVGYQEYLHEGGNIWEHFIDSIVILIILVINAILGFVQEYRAEKSIEALKKMSSLKAEVIRDGKEMQIDAKELVPGDIIKLSEGEKIPADSYLLEIANLQTQEASLTGESVPVKKEIRVHAENTPVADRTNMVFSGTVITSGKGKAVVCGTGMNTEIGKIAKMIQEAEPEPTHLQKKLAELGKFLGIAVIAISVIVFFTGLLLHSQDPIDLFLMAIALAVAAVPEGLPAVVTIGLAIGVQRMIKRNALVRKLPSVETLGATTVICTDKTGTLTRNEMTVKKLFVNGKEIEVTGTGYEAKGDFIFNNSKANTKDFELLLRIGAVNNDASIGNDYQVLGDPTEAALIVSAEKAGLTKTSLDKKYKRVDEIPFSSESKRMTTIHDVDGEKLAFMKGAPEVVLGLCNYINENGKVKKLTPAKKKEILEANKNFANEALRVLGFAYKTIIAEDRAEKNLIFVGLQAMIDPPRKQAKISIEKCRKAGIKVVMITGDYEETAKAIAREIGIKGKAMNGHELDEVKDLDKIVEEIGIFARVNPEHKLKIVEALKKKGHVVAMTGDGVNDAPAIKKADIGISMGITGTDVAKEASEMILTDDNFSSIVNAVEEGRGIYDNIKKFVEYLLSSNLGEVLTIFIATILGPLFGNMAPLLVVHLLWINLITDGAPALALAVEPLEEGIMNKKPRKPKENILSKSILIRMCVVGVLMMIGTLLLFKHYDPVNNLLYAQTVAFTALMMFQMFNVLNCRSEEHSLFKIGIFKNRWMLLAVGLSLILQLIVLYTPFGEYVFQAVPLELMDLLLIILVSSSVLWVVEIMKLFKRLSGKKNTS